MFQALGNWHLPARCSLNTWSSRDTAGEMSALAAGTTSGIERMVLVDLVWVDKKDMIRKCCAYEAGETMERQPERLTRLSDHVLDDDSAARS